MDSILDRRRRWYNRLNNRGKAVVILGLISITLIIVQYNVTENASRIKDIDTLREQKTRDSLSSIETQKLLDKNQKDIISSFAEALAKYGIKYDSTRKEIREIKEITSKPSSKTISINNGPDPTLSFCGDDPIELTSKDSTHATFKLSICSYANTAKNINTNLYCIVWEDGNRNSMRLAYQTVPFMKEEELPTTQKYVSGFNPFYIGTKDTKYYFVLKGTYTNSEGKEFPVEQIYAYLVNSKKSGIPVEPIKSMIKDFLKKKGL